MKKVEHTIETLDYIRKFSGETILIKLGGAALQDLDLVKNLAKDLARIQSLGIRVVLVHGGGVSINQALEQYQIQWSFIDGQRVTTPQMMDVVEMVLAGQMNGRLVRALNGAGVRAIGLSGTDDQLFTCKRQNPDLQQVGEITAINKEVLEILLERSGKGGEKPLIPVIAPVGCDAKGQSYNINADWAAVKLALALKIKKVIFLSDQEGILSAQKQTLSELDAYELNELIETQVVSGGMLAKVRTIIHALRQGVRDIHVLNARRPHVLIEELFTAQGAGTVCRAQAKVRRNGEKGIGV